MAMGAVSGSGACRSWRRPEPLQLDYEGILSEDRAVQQKDIAMWMASPAIAAGVGS
jgi:hypothetical protein